MSKRIIAALVVLALLAGAGCGSRDESSSIPAGMQATPSMSQAQLDAQNAKHKAFMAMKKSE